jgi:hypothetical protein
MTTAKTPKGRTVQVGKTTDHGVQEATGTGRYTETEVLFGGVQVSSFGYYSRRDLPAALKDADDFMDKTGLNET